MAWAISHGPCLAVLSGVGALICVKCGASHAVVSQVTMGAVSIILFVTCPVCKHQWDIDGKTPPLRRGSEPSKET